MSSPNYLATPRGELTDLSDALLAYSPNEIGYKNSYRDDPLLPASPHQLHDSLLKVIAATHSALRLFHRERPIEPYELAPKKRKPARRKRQEAMSLREELTRIDAPLLHLGLLRYHPLLIAMRFEPLRDDQGWEIPSHAIAQMSAEEHAMWFNRKLDLIRHLALKGHMWKFRNLRRQLSHFRRTARKRHTSVVTYVDQLLTHYSLLKVVPIQTGYDPSPIVQGADGEIPLIRYQVQWLLRLQRDRDALLALRHSHPLFAGLVGYVWQQRWSPEMGFYLHWWFFYSVDSPYTAYELSRGIGEHWRHGIASGRGKTLHPRGWGAMATSQSSARYKALGWVDALERYQPSREAVRALKAQWLGHDRLAAQWAAKMRELPTTEQAAAFNFQLTQSPDGTQAKTARKALQHNHAKDVQIKTLEAKQARLPDPDEVEVNILSRLDHLQAMLDAQIGIEYYVQPDTHGLVNQQGTPLQRGIQKEKGEQVLQRIRTLGKGEPPKGKPPGDTATFFYVAPVPGQIGDWVRRRGVPARRPQRTSR